jgi:Flp pilus assembly protein TadG
MRGRHLRRLARDQIGASLVEFALVAPVLAFVLVGVVDFAEIFSLRVTLEQAAYRALERVQAGPVQTDYSYLAGEAAAAAGVPASQATVTQWLECDGARQTDFNGSCAQGQQSARYVMITVNSSYTPRIDYGGIAAMLTGSSTASSASVSGYAAVRIQ